MKIAIFGLARSGLAALKFLVEKTNHEIFAINQGNARSWSSFSQVSKYISMDHCISQEVADELLASMDLIILSPGIAKENKSLKKAIDAGVEIISEIELAYQYSKVPVIAITGTNGKTTTSTMVAAILEKAGKKVFLGGNIGKAYCEIFNDDNYDYAVIEVSSFQLETIKTFKPQIAMLLNISHNHAERYELIDDYANAKYRIFENMDESQFAIIGKGLNKSNIKAHVGTINDLDNFDFSKSKLVGLHNKKNFYCAWKVLEILNFSNRDELMQEFINEFRGVKYRLQFIKEIKNLKFYNDAKSTNNDATRSAALAFQDSGEDIYLVVGGKLRSENVDLIESLQDLKIKEIFAFGESGSKLLENLNVNFKVNVYKDLEEIFKILEYRNLKGAFVFSPGFPSFDQYENYEKRGQHFEELVEKYNDYVIKNT